MGAAYWSEYRGLGEPTVSGSVKWCFRSGLGCVSIKLETRGDTPIHSHEDTAHKA
jgi:hypothetical protein